MNAAQNIPEMIEIAENERFRENLAKNMIRMPDLDGISMSPDSHFRFLMTMEKFCVIMCSMLNLSKDVQRIKKCVYMPS